MITVLMSHMAAAAFLMDEPGDGTATAIVALRFIRKYRGSREYEIVRPDLLDKLIAEADYLGTTGEYGFEPGPESTSCRKFAKRLREIQAQLDQAKATR